MPIYEIPLAQVPSQTVSANCDGQPCIITLRELGGRQYFSLFIDGAPICQSVLIVNNERIVNAAYTGFTGEFAAVDTVGNEPPNFLGWGDRWRLVFSNDA